PRRRRSWSLRRRRARRPPAGPVREGPGRRPAARRPGRGLMSAMHLVTSLDACPDPPAGSVVTIGAFDGVHLGHQALLRLVRERAAERGLPTALVTFDRHPAQVVRPESAPKLLNSLPQKLELLEATGLVDHAVVLTFDETRRQESAEDFVTEVLDGCLRARLVVVGADFHFGRDRRGNVALLERMGRDLGFRGGGLGLVRAGDAPPAAG